MGSSIRKLKKTIVGILFIISALSFIISFVMNIMSYFNQNIQYEHFWYAISAPFILLIGSLMAIIISNRVKKSRFLIWFWPAIKEVPDWMQISIYLVEGYTLFICVFGSNLINGNVMLSSILMGIYYVPMLVFMSYLRKKTES